jgi:hypothetical protein
LPMESTVNAKDSITLEPIKPEWLQLKRSFDYIGEYAEAEYKRFSSCSSGARSAQDVAVVIASSRRDYNWSEKEIAQLIQSDFLNIDKESTEEELGVLEFFDNKLNIKALEVAYQFATQYESNSSDVPEYDAGNAFWGWCMSSYSVDDVEKIRQKNFVQNEE